MCFYTQRRKTMRHEIIQISGTWSLMTSLHSNFCANSHILLFSLLCVDQLFRHTWALDIFMKWSCRASYYKYFVLHAPCSYYFNISLWFDLIRYKIFFYLHLLNTMNFRWNNSSSLALFIPEATAVAEFSGWRACPRSQ